ncbi:MAG: dihydrofolate reductase [Gammaproteobacteria bacterium]|nr:dihydrofolate reductase [Gammaproteobacteria bacterium]
MLISLIVAMDRRGVIGAGGALPWHLPADLQHFKRLTMGRPIVMGRRTHESIGRVLPGRKNIVLTRDRGYRAPGCTVLHSVEAVFDHCRNDEEVMIMGGADLYVQFMARAQRIYLTRVTAEVAGDTRFPDWQQLESEAWREVERQEFPADAANRFGRTFSVLERAVRPR